MITLTSGQQEITKRMKADIEREIGMCDDYADLMVLATTLHDQAKGIFSIYAQHMKSVAKNIGEEINKED